MTTPLRLVLPPLGLTSATTTPIASFSFSPSKLPILFHFLTSPSPNSSNPFIFSPSLALHRCFPEKRSTLSSRQMVYLSHFLSRYVVACSFRCEMVFWEVGLVWFSVWKRVVYMFGGVKWCSGNWVLLGLVFEIRNCVWFVVSSGFLRLGLASFSV